MTTGEVPPGSAGGLALLHYCKREVFHLSAGQELLPLRSDPSDEADVSSSTVAHPIMSASKVRKLGIPLNEQRMSATCSSLLMCRTRKEPAATQSRT